MRTKVDLDPMVHPDEQHGQFEQCISAGQTPRLLWRRRSMQI